MSLRISIHHTLTHSNSYYFNVCIIQSKDYCKGYIMKVGSFCPCNKSQDTVYNKKLFTKCLVHVRGGRGLFGVGLELDLLGAELLKSPLYSLKDL